LKHAGWCVRCSFALAAHHFRFRLRQCRSCTGVANAWRQPGRAPDSCLRLTPSRRVSGLGVFDHECDRRHLQVSFSFYYFPLRRVISLSIRSLFRMKTVAFVCLFFVRRNRHHQQRKRLACTSGLGGDGCGQALLRCAVFGRRARPCFGALAGGSASLRGLADKAIVCAQPCHGRDRRKAVRRRCSDEKRVRRGHDPFTTRLKPGMLNRKGRFGHASETERARAASLLLSQ
jgi:hypothetical protein